MNEIKKLRRMAKSKTQRELAALLKCNQSQVSRMLAGTAAPMRLDMAYRINKLFDKENGK